MTIKLETALLADIALQSMRIQCPISYHDMRGLHKLKQLLKVEREIYAETISQYVQTYKGTIMPDNTISFSDVEHRQLCGSAIQDLQNTTIDIDISPINLSHYSQNIVFDDPDCNLFALENFIIFEEEHKNES